MVVICTHVKIIIIGSEPHIYRVNKKIAVPTVYHMVGAGGSFTRLLQKLQQ